MIPPGDVTLALAQRAREGRPAVVGGAATIDYPTAATAVFVLTGDVDTTTVARAPPAGTLGTLLLWLRQDDTGGWSFVFPASFDWGGTGAPTIATGPGQETLVTAVTRDGGVTWKAGLVWCSV